MMNVFSTKKCRPFKIAETSIHRYPGFPQHMVKNKMWKLTDGKEFHRVYVYNKYGNCKEFVCDYITDEAGSFVRAQNTTLHICDKRGHEYFVYNIKRKK